MNTKETKNESVNVFKSQCFASRWFLGKIEEISIFET
jgi:hypothetical protein